MKKRANKKSRKVILPAFVITVAAIIIGCFFYINDYYRALPEALSVITDPSENITVIEEKNDRIVFAPENAKAGLIFYPGGKVQYEAYAPLMEALAEQGIMCILLHMPANLAVLDMDAAEGITADYPDIEKWYIGGHSLGGSMAASYAAEHTDEFDGLILLAAYSTAGLRESGLNVISVYGSEDGVLNQEKYQEYRDNLPENFCEEIIDGGNHAYFGTYGLQEGDGAASVSNEEQIQAAADIITRQLDVK